MSTELAVLANNPSLVHAAGLNGYLHGRHGLGFWHLYASVWVISDPENNSIAWWRDQIRRAVPGFHFIVVRVKPEWASYGPIEDAKWFEENFG